MPKHCITCHMPLKRIGVKFVHLDGTPKCFPRKSAATEAIEALEEAAAIITLGPVSVKIESALKRLKGE